MDRTSTIPIRPAGADDIRGVIALFEAVAAEGRWIGTEPGFDKDRYRRSWEMRIASGSDALIVAADAEDIVGAIDLRENERGDWSFGMLVGRERRRQGVGTALLDAAIEWARARGIRALTLGVYPHNEAAIRLYERNGFVRTGTVEKSPRRQKGEIWDIVLMERGIETR